MWPERRPAAARPRRLRVAYLTDTMASIQLLETLAADHDVTLVSPASLGEGTTNFWPPPSPLAIDRVTLPGGRFTFVIRAARWLRRNRQGFDAAVALDELGAALAANLGRAAGGPPVVLQVGRPTLEYLDCKLAVDRRLRVRLRRGLAAALTAFNQRRAAAVGTVSEYLAAQVARRNPHARAVPWQGIDVERFSSIPDRTLARRRLGLPEDRPVVLWRSRVAPEKDPRTFLRAMRSLQDQGRHLCVAAMGGELDLLREEARTWGVAVVGRNAASPDEIPDWYRAADVLVQASHAEGLGLSVLEALACGTPAVVTDVGGLPETVDGGRCGALVPPGDHRALARAVAERLDHPARASAEAARGRRYVEGRYTTEHARAGWRQLLEQAAGEDPPPRVLFVDHEVRLSGGELDMVDLVRGLPPGAVEIHAAFPEEGPVPRRLRELGAHVHLVPMAGPLRRASRWDLARRPWLVLRHLGSATATAWRLARLTRRLRPRIVHSHSLKAHLLAAPAARLMRLPHVWHVKDILSAGWLRRAFVFAAGLVAARVVCISHAVARPFAGSRAGAKTTVVHCGLRPPAPGADAVERARSRFGAGDTVPLVGMVGRTARWKGHDVFLDAVERVARHRADVRFAVVAGCLFPENEGDFDETMRRRAAAPLLADRVTWLDDYPDLPAAMAGFDLLVHASRLPEPFGRVVVEAMAQGTPVVSTTLGAGPELVPPAAGRLVDPGDPAALAEVLLELLDDPAKLRAMGEAARVEAQRFDIDVAGAAMLQLYREVAR